MSVWIPYLRSSPTGGPSQKRARRDQGCVPVVRADGCRLAAAKSVCGSPERAADGLGGAPSALKQARDVAGTLCGREERRGVTSGSRSSGGAPGSHSITDSCGLVRGHPGIDPRRCRPLDPARCDSAPKPRVLVTGEISPASFPVSAARWPTRRTACSFSPAVSLGDDGPFARPLSVPPSRLCCHGSSLHPRGSPQGEPVGVIEHRRATSDPAAKTCPERFTKRPTPDRVPTKAWINRPSIQRA